MYHAVKAAAKPHIWNIMKFENVLLATAAAVFPFTAAAAQQTAGSAASAVPDAANMNDGQQSSPKVPAPATPNIVITGRRLDVARDAITPSLGASQYTFDREALNKQPGGTNLTLNKSLLQAPGVTQDSYGAIHVRNEHANLQYRLDGVIVPESISGFGTTFDPKIASSIQLITGTLPAQYGYRTAGVVNFKTESGRLGNGGEAGVYGGSDGWLEPSASVQGSAGNFSYFLSGSYLRNDIGIENPLPTRRAIHDRTTQYRPFAYFSDILSDTSRIALFGGSFIGHFQIPNVTGVASGFNVNVVSTSLPAKDCGGDENCSISATSTVPFAIADQQRKTGQLYGAYLQDEWKITPTLTLNYGARYDVIHAYTRESQLSPRANLVWNAAPLTTLHLGYARNFTPPPQELIAPTTVALFNATTKQSLIRSGDAVKAEREHYFDGGIEQRVKGGFKLAIDAYYKLKH